VFFFVGPPGHGKSEFGEAIGRHVAPANFVRINCGNISDGKWGLFGSDPGYVGSGQSTDLSAFIRNHDGRFGVCVLEEFEKLGPDAREGLLHPFESGEWSNKQFGGSRPSDCSKILFILTSNLINVEITRKLEQENLPQKFAQEKDQSKKDGLRQDIVSLVTDMVKSELKKQKPVEFVRRIHVIPFITHSKLELHVIALQEQDRMRSRYALPPEGSRLVGSILLHFMENFTEHVIEDYDPLQGASSLKSPVGDSVDSIILSYAKQEKPPSDAWIFIGKYGGAARFSFSRPEPSEMGNKNSSHDSEMADIHPDSNSSNENPFPGWKPNSDSYFDCDPDAY